MFWVKKQDKYKLSENTKT